MADPLTEEWVLAADGRMYPPDRVAVDAGRTPTDPELVAGPLVADPWDAMPDRWAGTEPVEPEAP